MCGLAARPLRPFNGSESLVGDPGTCSVDVEDTLAMIELRLAKVGTLKFVATGGVLCPEGNLRVESRRGERDTERELDLDVGL